MDDDFGFGGPSVWGDTSQSSSPAQAQAPVLTTLKTTAFATTSSPFDEFEDAFADDDDQAFTQAQPASGGDDFDDFGDFDEGGGDTLPEDNDFPEDSPSFEKPMDDTLRFNADWQPLRLNPLPTSGKLAEQIHTILSPLWDDRHISDVVRDGNIRQVEGVNQTLVSAESRSLYQTLFQTNPSNMQPVDWIRCRVRRRHLVACGIPVNLDEVLPHVNGKTMPALKIITRPVSAPPGPRQISRNGSPAPATTTNSRAGTPQPTIQQNTTHPDLGPQPELDRSRITRLLELKPETLPLMSVGTLEAHAASLQSMTESASALLTHLLQTRDALQQNSETYNGLIAELVSEAQKMKSSSITRKGSVRRGSGLV